MTLSKALDKDRAFVVAVHKIVQDDGQDLIYTHTKNLRDACTFVAWYHTSSKVPVWANRATISYIMIWHNSPYMAQLPSGQFV